MLTFATNKVAVVTSLHKLFAEILGILNPHVQFDIVNILQLKDQEEILVLDAPHMLRWIKPRIKPTQSVIVYGGVKHGATQGILHHWKIIESEDIIVDLWNQFQKYWNDLSETFLPKDRNIKLMKLPWLNQEVMTFVKCNYMESKGQIEKLVLKLPEFHSSDWRHDQYLTESLYVRGCFDFIINLSIQSKTNSGITLLLCLSREKILTIGRERISITACQGHDLDLHDHSNERELCIKGRIYRCLLVLKPVSETYASVLLMENPRIEIVVWAYHRAHPLLSYYHVKFIIRQRAPGLVGEAMNDIPLKLLGDQLGMRYMTANDCSGLISRPCWMSRFMQQFICTRSFAEQDSEANTYLRGSVNALLKEFGCDSSTTMTPTEAFTKVVARLKMAQTLRYTQLKLIWKCVDEAFAKAKHGDHRCSIV